VEQTTEDLKHEVILNDHVEHLGDRGTTLEVKPGYARNFLIPKGFGL